MARRYEVDRQVPEAHLDGASGLCRGYLHRSYLPDFVRPFSRQNRLDHSAPAAEKIRAEQDPPTPLENQKALPEMHLRGIAQELEVIAAFQDFTWLPDDRVRGQVKAAQLSGGDLGSQHLHRGEPLQPQGQAAAFVALEVGDEDVGQRASCQS